MTQTILASASPRRVELLEKMGIAFSVAPSHAEEEQKETIGKHIPKEKVESLSFLKAADIAERFLQEKAGESEMSYLVIGSDTVVSVDETILEKPKDREDASQMIRKIAGGVHTVYTAVTMIYLSEEAVKEGEKKRENEKIGMRVTELQAEGKVKIKTFFEQTDVEVYPMEEDEIASYVAGEEPYDKAGAYAIQGEFAKFIKGIKGDYTTVMGLPVGRLYQEMKKMGKRGEERCIIS